MGPGDSTEEPRDTGEPGTRTGEPDTPTGTEEVVAAWIIGDTTAETPGC